MANFAKDYRDGTGIDAVGLENVKKALDKLKTDLATQKELHGKLVDEWNADFLNEFGMKLLSVDSLEQLKNNQEKHTDYDQIKADLNKWTSTFPTEKYKNGVDDVSTTIINLEGSK